RRDVDGGLTSSDRSDRRLQAAHGLELPVGVRRRRRLQPRLPRLRQRGGTARGHRRVQLRAARRLVGLRGGRRQLRRPGGRLDRHRRPDLHARSSGRERVRARGRRRLPHVLGLRAGRRRPLGHVPVARPGAEGPERVRLVVPPTRRVRRGVRSDGHEALRGLVAVGRPTTVGPALPFWPDEAVIPRRSVPGASPYVRSYLIMRFLVGLLGIAVPVLLVLGEPLLFYDRPFPLGSPTTYHYSAAPHGLV